MDKELEDRLKLIQSITNRESMAMSAFQYQTWLVTEVLDWLDKNGYEVRKKIVVPQIVVN